MPFRTCALLGAFLLAGCTQTGAGHVVDVELALENHGSTTAAMRLYVVTRGTGPEGQDAWHPPRVEGMVEPNGRLAETEQLVVSAGDPVYWLWATAYDVAMTTRYAEVPDSCRGSQTWTGTAIFDGDLEVTATC